jgi:hypothetical protein
MVSPWRRPYIFCPRVKGLNTRFLLSRKESEKCISGIATLRKHCLPMQRKRKEGKRASVYKNTNFK